MVKPSRPMTYLTASLKCWKIWLWDKPKIEGRLTTPFVKNITVNIGKFVYINSMPSMQNRIDEFVFNAGLIDIKNQAISVFTPL